MPMPVLRVVFLASAAMTTLTACQTTTRTAPPSYAAQAQAVGVMPTAYSDALYDGVFYGEAMRTKGRWCGADAKAMASLDEMSGRLYQMAAATLPFQDIDRAQITGTVASKDYDCSDATFSMLARQIEAVKNRMEATRAGRDAERSLLRLFSVNAGAPVELKRGAIVCNLLDHVAQYGAAIANHDRAMLESMAARKECTVLSRPMRGTVTTTYKVAVAVRIYLGDGRSADGVTFITDIQKL